MTDFQLSGKAKRYPLFVGVGVIALGIAVIGCGGGGASVIVNPFAGQYEGTLDGDANALFTVSVDSKGKVTGTLEDGQNKPVTGTVTLVGDASWAATPANPEAEVGYLLEGNCDANGCNGTWFGSTGLNGTWTGTKQ